MTKVKVFGAGSIGNHLSNAARRLGWSVDLCDRDPAALKRTKESIYPSRYQQWDDGITLFEAKDVPAGGYDYIVVGTPPDSHMALALAAVRERPRAVLVEKPLCTPDLDGAQRLLEESEKLGVPVFVGYDHVVGKASETLGRRVRADGLGPIDTLDVEFREHWGGIFGAHPWLNGPGDTYLGYWKKGGGASGEHSHAANLWQHFALEMGKGRVVEVAAALQYVSDGTIDYDNLCLLTLRTEGGLLGRVVQDVVTNPPRKWARVQGRDGYLEWHCGFKPGCDAVIEGRGKEQIDQVLIEKTRPDDFIQELRHIEAALVNPEASPIALVRGLDTMLVVAAAHKAHAEGAVVTIDYGRGYSMDALRTGR